MMISTGEDMSLRLWDVASGHCRAEIQHHPYYITSFSWIQMTNANHLVTGCSDGALAVWQIERKMDRFDFRLKWRTTTGELRVNDAYIKGVQGLNPFNTQFLVGRGAWSGTP
jgi:WD40 repeat protein